MLWRGELSGGRGMEVKEGFAEEVTSQLTPGQAGFKKERWVF